VVEITKVTHKWTASGNMASLPPLLWAFVKIHNPHVTLIVQNDAVKIMHLKMVEPTRQMLLLAQQQHQPQAHSGHRAISPILANLMHDLDSITPNRRT